jgi:excisionase family DNA binding protein
MSDELMTVAQVAERLKVNPETVRRWLRAGQMSGTLLGDRAGWRIPASEVNRLLPHHCRGCGQPIPLERRAVGEFPCDRCGQMVAVQPFGDGRIAAWNPGERGQEDDPKAAA